MDTTDTRSADQALYDRLIEVANERDRLLSVVRNQATALEEASEREVRYRQENEADWRRFYAAMDEMRGQLAEARSAAREILRHAWACYVSTDILLRWQDQWPWLTQRDAP